MCRKSCIVIDLQALHKILLIPKPISADLALLLSDSLDAFLKYIPVDKFLTELGYFTFLRSICEIYELLPIEFILLCVRVEIVEGCFIVFYIHAEILLRTLTIAYQQAQLRAFHRYDLHEYCNRQEGGL